MPPVTASATVAPTIPLPLYDLAASSTCEIGETLQLGDAGDGVDCLQRRLDEITPASDVAIDGVFGTDTDSQIRLFQTVHNLSVDGIVGAQTAGMLNIWNPTPAPPPPPPAPVQPVAAVAAVTAPSGDCNPNYTGCVPNDSDVDCAGGSGNGPSYTGQVSVIGRDVYDLDRDSDGVACD